MKTSKILPILLVAALLAGCSGQQTAPAQTSPESTNTASAAETTVTSESEASVSVSEAQTSDDGVWYSAAETERTEEVSSDLTQNEDSMDDDLSDIADRVLSVNFDYREPTVNVDYEPDGEVTDMDFTYVEDEETFSGKYTGSVKDNVPEGYGVFECNDGNGSSAFMSVYWKNGEPMGVGRIDIENSSRKVTMEGEFTKDGTIGECTMSIYEKSEYNLTVFTGVANDGLFNGKCVIEYYIARFEDDDPDKEIYFDKILTYTGNVKENVFDGEGELIASVADENEIIESNIIGTFRDGDIWSGTVTNTTTSLKDDTVTTQMCDITDGVQGEFYEPEEDIVIESNDLV